MGSGLSDKNAKDNTTNMQNFNNFTAILNLIGLSTVGPEFMQILTDIVTSASLERRVNTILCTSYGNNTYLETQHKINSAKVVNALTKTTQDRPASFLHLDSTPPITRFVSVFNTELLSIALLNHQLVSDEQLLKALWQRLWRNRQSRLLLLFDDTASVHYVTSILRLCMNEQAFNVIALQPQMAVIVGAYWTVRIFPAHAVVRRRFALDYSNVFPKHLANMHGQPLRIYAKAWYPQIYTFTPAKGNSTLSGYLGRALLEYAKVHNATIEYPLTLHRKFYTFEEFYDFFENNTIDIGSLTPIEDTNRNLSYSVVFSRINWCLMVPMEQALPKSRIYYNMIQKTVIILFGVCLMLTSCLWAFVTRWQAQPPPSLIEHFFNVSLFQGLLGMPFRMRRHISMVHKIMCFTISLAGVLIVTAYITYLQSFSVNTPIGDKLETIPDLLNAGIKLAVSTEELNYIPNNWEYREYIRNFTIFENVSELLILRDSLDTNYAFAVYDMWTIYDEQQKYFSRPLFRFSDICFSRNAPMVLPLQESSVHRQSMNEFLARLHEAGLINYWTRHSFYELLQMNWIFLEDPNQNFGYKPMKLDDLQEIFVVIGILFTLCVICFVFELFEITINRIAGLTRRIVTKSKY